jgi:hypothetical protein
MSKDQKGFNEAPDHDADGIDQESKGRGANGTDDSAEQVSYHTYKRVLGNLKKTEKEKAQLLDELQKREDEKLQAEGKKDDLITRITQERDEAKKQVDLQNRKYAYQLISTQVMNEIAKRGAKDPGALVRLLDSEFSNLEWDENMTVNESDLRRMVDSAQKKYPYFFEKAAPNVNDGIPAGAPINAGKTLKDLSLDEKLRMLAVKSRPQ